MRSFIWPENIVFGTPPLVSKLECRSRAMRTESDENEAWFSVLRKLLYRYLWRKFVTVTEIKIIAIHQTEIRGSL